MLKFYFASIISCRLNTFMRKGKDPEPDPDPYLKFTDSDSRIVIQISNTGRNATEFIKLCIRTTVPGRLFYTALQWISHRPRSQNTSKERTLSPEKDSTRKRPRSHVSLEKSSKNYKPLENWANQISSLTSLHSRQPVLATEFGGFATWWSQNRENFLPFSPAK